MYGDHTALVICRGIICGLAILSFFLFFIGLGTQTWFVATNGDLSFSLSPVTFCDASDSCSSLSWSTMPAPPAVCGVTTTELENRYRTVTGFTVLAGLLTILVTGLALFTFGQARRDDFVRHICCASAASGSFGFIAAALWGYTLENFQYCGTTYCVYMRLQATAYSGCTETLGNSFNSIIVGDVFMCTAALLAGAHIIFAPRLDRASSADGAADGAGASPGTKFDPVVRPRSVSALAQQRFEEDRAAGAVYGSPARPLSIANRSRSIPGSGFQKTTATRTAMGTADGEELVDFSQRGRSQQQRTTTSGANNSRNNARQQQQQQQRQKVRNAWAPPPGSDYAREPTTGLWWSASRPNEYIEARTGHVLLVDENLWYDPINNVYFEVESQ